MVVSFCLSPALPPPHTPSAAAPTPRLRSRQVNPADMGGHPTQRRRDHCSSHRDAERPFLLQRRTPFEHVHQSSPKATSDIRAICWAVSLGSGSPQFVFPLAICFKANKATSFSMSALPSSCSIATPPPRSASPGVMRGALDRASNDSHI